MPWQPRSHYDRSFRAINKPARDAAYDRSHHRDPIIVRFYRSAAWRKLRALKINSDPVCEYCLTEPTAEVHHEEPVKVNFDKALEYANLKSACKSCHKIHEGKD
jgi:5-methylcytosine-specific restriction endonuclease McrA